MKEDFLHFVWQHGLFAHQNLRTSCGQQVQILQRGSLNHNSGPDFSEAHLRLNGQSWYGNVELHIRSSDWNRHGHQQDPAYNNTILHVVFINDGPVSTLSGESPPCLELKNLIPGSMYQNYQELQGSLATISCQQHRPAKMEAQVLQMTHRALVERLVHKAAQFRLLLQSVNADWNSAFYIHLSRYLGFKTNADAMETLARNVPLLLVQRNAHSLLSIEALLFGQAGMLQASFSSEYYRHLRKEYAFLQHKYKLQSMNPAAWKFMRMRPVNFPTLRIAQLAPLLQREPHLFSKLLEAHGAAEMRQILRSQASAFWTKHYHFHKKSVEHSASIGDTALDGLLINVVAVVLFCYGQEQGSDEYKERAIDLLAALDPESNRVTRLWQQLGFANKSAYESQAYMGLFQMYCQPKRCLDCAIGQKILSRSLAPNEDKLPITPVL